MLVVIPEWNIEQTAKQYQLVINNLHAANANYMIKKFILHKV